MKSVESDETDERREHKKLTCSKDGRRHGENSRRFFDGARRLRGEGGKGETSERTRQALTPPSTPPRPPGPRRARRISRRSIAPPLAVRAKEKPRGWAGLTGIMASANQIRAGRLVGWISAWRNRRRIRLHSEAGAHEIPVTVDVVDAADGGPELGGPSGGRRKRRGFA